MACVVASRPEPCGPRIALPPGEAHGVGAGRREAAQVLARRQLGRRIDQHRDAVRVRDRADPLQRQAEVLGAGQVRDGHGPRSENAASSCHASVEPMPSLAG